MGVPDTKTDDEGAFELKNMNDVLHETRVREALDEKLWSFLKVLYADKRGINLPILLSTASHQSKRSTGPMRARGSEYRVAERDPA